MVVVLARQGSSVSLQIPMPPDVCNGFDLHHHEYQLGRMEILIIWGVPA